MPKSRKIILTVILAIVFFGLPLGSKKSMAAHWYVDNSCPVNGNNSGHHWNCGADGPWNSLANIRWTDVQPGDVVYISGGPTSKTYNEWFQISAVGRPDRLITIKPGEDVGHNGTVIIDGSKNHPAYGTIWTQGSDYIRIEGLEVMNSPGHGLMTGWDSSHGYGIEIANCNFHDNGRGSDSAALYLANCHGCLVEGNHLHHNSGDGITLISVLSPGITIRKNHIHDNGTDGIKGGGSGTILIEGNSIHNMSSGVNHGDGLQYMGSGTVILRNGYWADSTQNIYIDTYGGGPEAVYIYNNEVVNTAPGEGGIGGYYNGISVDMRYADIGALYLFNNTCVNLNNGGGCMSANSGGTSHRVGSIVVENNIFLNSLNGIDPGVVSGTMISGKNLYFNQNRDWYFPGWVNLEDWRAMHPTLEAGSSYSDPKLVAEAPHRLQKDSPAIDQGKAESTYFTVDKDLVNRPQGKGWDIGAYEFVPPKDTTPPAVPAGLTVK